MLVGRKLKLPPTETAGSLRQELAYWKTSPRITMLDLPDSVRIVGTVATSTVAVLMFVPDGGQTYMRLLVVSTKKVAVVICATERTCVRTVPLTATTS